MIENVPKEISESGAYIDETPSYEPTETQKSIEVTQEAEKTATDTAEGIDYAALMENDIAELKAQFPELVGISDVTDLNNPLRYAALRDMGLSPAEAYLATAKRVNRDTRSHLKSAHGRTAAASEITMSPFELATARELFPGKNDAELQRLYRKVNR